MSVREKQPIIVGGSLGGAFVLILIAVVIAFVKLYKTKVQGLQNEIRKLTNKEVDEFFDGDPQINLNEEEATVLALPFVKDFEISREELIVDCEKVLGSGNFGCVMQGFIKLSENNGLMPVAVKTVKANVEILPFKAMLSEAKVMAYLGEVFIALELCPLGDLRKFLIKNRNNYQSVFGVTETSLNDVGSLNVDAYSALNLISTQNLLTWSLEISNGMMYLTEKKVIHGDLAARNVLLTANRVAQISDFGLSRQLLNYAYYKKMSEGPLPWRWMAVETLNDMKFSVASDVWAFGVTLWEIFSLGQMPYPGWTFNYAFVDRLTKGERLPLPQYTNEEIFQLMNDCWNLNPNERPAFKIINKKLGKTVSDMSTLTK